MVGGHVKGVAVRALLLWYESEVDPKLSGVGAVLPAWTRGTLDPSRPALGILPASWVPSRAYHAILDAMIEGTKGSKLKLAEKGAAAVMGATLHGIYASLFRQFATPSLYERYAQRAWRMYYDNGVCQVRIVGNDQADARVSHWQGHHPLLCDMTMEAGRLIFQAMGKREVKAEREACVAEGAPDCRSIVSWQN